MTYRHTTRSHSTWKPLTVAALIAFAACAKNSVDGGETDSKAGTGAASADSDGGAGGTGAGAGAENDGGGGGEDSYWNGPCGLPAHEQVSFSDTAECDSCIESKCCDAAGKCTEGTDCGDMLQCAIDCGDDEQCNLACYSNATEDAKTDLGGVLDCLKTCDACGVEDEPGLCGTSLTLLDESEGCVVCAEAFCCAEIQTCAGAGDDPCLDCITNGTCDAATEPAKTCLAQNCASTCGAP